MQTMLPEGIFAWPGIQPSRYVILPTSEEVVRVYTSSIEDVTRGVELEETSRFPNVELIETEDQTIYLDSRNEDSFPWISPLQTYLMLAKGGKRESEAAEELRTELLNAGNSQAASGSA